MRLAICADHNGVETKARLVEQLTGAGHTVTDVGTDSTEVVDYPALCRAICDLVSSGAADLGVVVGGSGQGEAIYCNKIRGIRAGLCQTEFDAGISRGHNDANVLVLGAKILTSDQAAVILQTWLTTAFKGGRHAERVASINALDDDR